MSIRSDHRDVRALFVTSTQPAAVEFLTHHLVVIVLRSELLGQTHHTTEGVVDVDTEAEVLEAKAIVDTTLIGRRQSTRVEEIVNFLGIRSRPSDLSTTLRAGDVAAIRQDISTVREEEARMPVLVQLVEGDGEE